MIDFTLEKMTELFYEVKQQRDRLLYVLEAIRPLFLSAHDCYTSYRDQLRDGRVPKPGPAYAMEDDYAVQTIKRMDVILAEVRQKREVEGK